jgi:hypothetical protein
MKQILVKPPETNHELLTIFQARPVNCVGLMNVCPITNQQVYDCQMAVVARVVNRCGIGLHTIFHLSRALIHPVNEEIMYTLLAAVTSHPLDKK